MKNFVKFLSIMAFIFGVLTLANAQTSQYATGNIFHSRTPNKAVKMATGATYLDSIFVPADVLSYNGESVSGDVQLNTAVNDSTYLLTLSIHGVTETDTVNITGGFHYNITVINDTTVSVGVTGNTFIASQTYKTVLISPVTSSNGFAIYLGASTGANAKHGTYVTYLGNQAYFRRNN